MTGDNLDLIFAETKVFGECLDHFFVGRAFDWRSRNGDLVGSTRQVGDAGTLGSSFGNDVEAHSDGDIKD